MEHPPNISNTKINVPKNQELYRDVLNEGYTLHWYEVKSVLGRGAFGVTYLARDKNLDQLVAIKEYFPRDFSSRASGHTVHPTTGEKQELYEWGLVRFVREARTLAKFKHHNIVRVMSVFELNNTAYMVMEYEQGEELSRIYKRRGKFSEQQLLNIFLPIMDGLKLVHDAGFIHRDIKPSNILIRTDGSPVLIDFGAARQTIGTPTRTVTSLVTYGYAPFEQYNEGDDKQGAWTDIYSLGACLYLAAVGKLPQESMARGSSLLSNGMDPYVAASDLKKGTYSPEFLHAIDCALMFRASDRPQDIRVWADMLSGKTAIPPTEEARIDTPDKENGEETTVIMTKPPRVSDVHDRTSQRVTMPATSSPAITPQTIPPTIPSAPSTAPTTPPTSSATQLDRIVSTPKPAMPSPKPRRSINPLVSATIVLSLITVGALLVFWKQSGPTQTQEVVEKIEQTTETAQQQLASLLQSANEAYKKGNLLDKDGGAIYLYQQILNIDTANSQAANRIQVIIELYADEIRSDLLKGLTEKASSNLKLLQDAAPDSALVLTLIKEAQITKSKQADIAKLRQQADADFKAGRLIRPDNKSALLKYRQILSLAPGDSNAERGIENILAHYEKLANANLAKGNISQVEHNIRDILYIDPDSVVVNNLRTELQALKSQTQRQQDITQLLSQAQRAFNVGNLISPVNNNAHALYQQVLKFERNNSRAKQGIKEIETQLKSQFNKYLLATDFLSAESVMRQIETVMPKSKLARDIRAQWDKSKPTAAPDIEVINEIIGKFKQSFELRNINALRNMSEFQTNRQSFLQQLYNNYSSFKIDITDVQLIGRERKGSATISLKDLVNVKGASVTPGTWSQFQIVIRENTEGQWKVFW